MHALAGVSERQERETSVKIKDSNNELVLFTGQQLNGRSRLFGAVPWVLRNWKKFSGMMDILQSSRGEQAEERRWLIPAAVPRWHCEPFSAVFSLKRFPSLHILKLLTKCNFFSSQHFNILKFQDCRFFPEFFSQPWNETNKMFSLSRKKMFWLSSVGIFNLA